MYNKLFTKILDSTIWLESDSTRLVWITFLAVMDEDGFAALSSVGNVAARARVSFEAAESAIKALESPDPNDPSQEHRGRRIERVPYGWMVLNAGKYRDIIKRETAREQTRIRVARFRDRHSGNADVTVDNEKVTPSVSVSEAVSVKNPLVGLTPSAAPKMKVLRQQAAEVIAFLNDKAGRNFDLNGANADFVIARLKDGETPEDCRAIVAFKARKWKGDPKMAEYLRPKTLFNRTNFATYKGELPKVLP